MSPVMQIATGGNMLNFGYWDKNNCDPISAQENLCSHFADLSQLSSAKKIIDVGSGLSGPAIYWKKKFNNISVNCVNINYSQLNLGKQSQIESINSSSIVLPFANNSVDRVLALESAQHFKPLSEFILESKRVLNDSGLLTLAIPVTLNSSSISDLGILKFTWSSEHYSAEQISKLVETHGFILSEEQFIGSSVYDPLSDYYVEHREELRKSILKQYPSYVESILFKSIKKMKKASEEKIIDYVLLKCHLEWFLSLG